MQIKFIKKFGHVGKSKGESVFYETGTIAEVDKDISLEYSNIAIDTGYAEKVSTDKTDFENKVIKKKKKR